MRRDFAQKLLLINAHPQGGQDFEVELSERSEAEVGDGFIQHGAPAQHAHDNLRGKVAVDRGELVEQRGMQKFVRVSRFALHAQQDVECGESRWRDSHSGLP